jgi:hypothetical protein
MKKIPVILGAAFLLSSCLLWGFRPESPEPMVHVDRVLHDFGNIPATEPVTTEFTVTNRGGKPLNIARVGTTCGCTAAVVGNQMLKPGEATKLKVSYDPRGKSGQQSRAVTIFSNDPRSPQLAVNISANITPGSAPAFPQAATSPVPSATGAGPASGTPANAGAGPASLAPGAGVAQPGQPQVAPVAPGVQKPQ